MTNRPPPGTLLCRIDEIADPGSRGFTFGSGMSRFGLFVVHAQGQIHGYVNACPHAKSPLDWDSDGFLTPDKSQIICSMHGATFRIADGLCIRGPCPGRRLTPMPLDVRDGEIRVGEEVPATS